MDLFVVNRYLGDNESGKTNHLQENDHLAKLLLKIEERKKNKKKDTKCKTRGKPEIEKEFKGSKETVVENALTPEETTIDGDEHNISSKKKPKKRKLKLLEQVDACEPANLQENENKQEQTKLDDPQMIAQSGGFTVIGIDQFQKKTKVKRILPFWLANPSIVSVNLQDLITTVDDIHELDKDIVQRLKENNVTHFFPVQSQVIPWLLTAHSKPAQYWPCDVCVSAPTGSGKTLAFVIPIVQALKNRVVHHIRALIVLPVQDLAMQVFKVFKNYCSCTSLKVALITGQSSFQKEQSQLVKTSTVCGPYSLVDIVVTTPGRLVDHLKSTPGFSLKHLRFLVIDEADRVMESIQNDWLYHVEKHINAGVRPFLTVESLETASPPPPQKLLFSATLSQDPEKLQQIGLFQPKLFTSVVGEQNTGNGKFSEGDDVRGDFIGKFTTPAELKERFCSCSVSSKPLVLYHLLSRNRWRHVLCFASSQQAAHRLALLLKNLGQEQFTVAEISSALKRLDRDKILHKFSSGEVDVLVSSDALARGMDIPGVDYVVSYDPPKYVKNYIHRIGRTGRAGRQGTAVTLLLSNQLNHFQQMLQTAGKTSVSELTVEEFELEALEEQYKNALDDLKQHLEVEQAELLKKVKAVKSCKTLKQKQKYSLQHNLKKSKMKIKIRTHLKKASD